MVETNHDITIINMFLNAPISMSYVSVGQTVLYCIYCYSPLLELHDKLSIQVVYTLTPYPYVRMSVLEVIPLQSPLQSPEVHCVFMSCVAVSIKSC